MPGKLGGPITPISPISPTTPTSRTRRLLFLSAVFIIPTLLTLAAYQLFGPDRARASWYYDGETEWAYRQTITINNSQVAGSSSHTNFPVMIRLDNHTDLQTYAQSTGADILFTDSNNSKLDHEIESYDSATGSLVAWVRIPSLSPSSDTTIYMYYGSPGSSDQQNLTEVWDSDFVLVQHLQETTTGDTDFLDSTSNAHDSSEVQFDAAGSSADATGIANGAVIFDDSASAGDNDYITIPDHDDLTPADDITVEVWLNLDKLPSTQAERPDVIFKANTGPPYSAYYIDFDITGDDADHPRFFWRNSSSTSFEVYGPDAFSTGSWYYIAGTRTGDSLKIHVNGSATSAASPPGASDTLLNSTSTLYIGSIGGFNPTAGSIDEIRISSTARSDDWITTTYNTINNPDDFITLGDQEQQPNSDTTDPRLPVAYWKFDEGQGLTANDSTTNANHGTITGATWATEDMCISGKCLQFDGDDDVTTTNHTTLSFGDGTTDSPFSISTWIKSSNITTNQGIISKATSAVAGEYYLYQQSANIFFRVVDDSTGAYMGIQSANLMTPYLNTWVHVTATYDGSGSTSGMKLYLNGNLTSTSTSSNGSYTAMETTNTPVTLGKRAEYLQGFLDEVKIYPYARTAEEVRSDYLRGAGKAGSSAVLGATDTAFLNQGLVGYWKMDELSGTTVTDASGNGNHGTLTNAQESGTSDASGNSTTTLVDTTSELLSETDDAYNGMILRFTATCGSITSGTERLITDYTGTTKTLTVGTALAAAPDSCAYEIRHQVGGKFGSGMAFDGDSSYINVPDSNPLNFGANQNFSASFWFKTRDASSDESYPGLLYKGANTTAGPKGWLVSIGGDAGSRKGKIGAAISDGVTRVSTDHTPLAYDDDAWHHAIVVYERNSNLVIYVDGTPQTSADISQFKNIDLSNSIDLDIGRRLNSLHYTGLMDEVRIYNRALSASEVQVLYSWAPGPVGHWKFDEGSGTTAYDSSGNNLTGTLLNSTDWGTGKYGSAQHITDIDGYTRIGDNDITDIMAGNFTWKGWFKTSQTDRGLIYRKSDAGNANGVLIDIGNGTPGIVRCNVHYNPAISVNTSNTYNDGQWHHYACVFDRNSSLKLYIDGQLDGNTTSTTLTNTMLNGAGPISIGFYHSYSLLGLLDDVRIYNYARTQEQILEDMYAGHPIATVESPQPNITQALGGSTEDADLADGAGDPPIAEWKFDEKQGDTASDSSGNGNDGDITGATWASAGQCKQGACLSFDGTSDFVNMGDVLDVTTNDFTIEAWIKYNSYSTYNFIVSKGGVSQDCFTSGNQGYALFLVSGKPYLRLNTGSAQSCISINTDDPLSEGWHHLTAVADRNGNGYMYVNGTLINTVSISSHTNTLENTQSLKIGTYSTSNGNYFDGLIDHVKIYDYARTPAQIAYDYNRGAPVAWYKFDECQGTTIYDSSGNANHGTLSLGESGVTSAGTCQTESTAWGNGATGKYSSAMSFDDSDDYIQLTNPLTFDTITYSAWVKITSNQSGTIASQGVSSYTSPPHGGIALSAGVPRMYSGYFDSQYRYAQATTNVNNDSWNHIVGVSDDNGTYIYVNGVLEGQDNTYKVSDSAANPTYFGIGAQIRSTDRQNLFGGLIDDVRIYNYALSATQIKKLYNANSAIRFSP